MSKKVLIAITHLNPRWLRIYSERISAITNLGSEIYLLDLSGYSFPSRQTLLGRFWLKEMAGHSNVSLIALPSKKLSSRTISQTEPFLSSDLYSYFKDDSPQGFLAKTFLHSLGLKLAQMATGLSQTIDALKIEEVYISNGRGAAQRVLAHIVSQKIDISVLYLETGMPHNPTGDKYFLAEYPIHDRIARQADFLKSSMTEAKVREISDSWLLPRTSATSRTNAFAGLWDDTLTVTSHENVFFTSSTDEYWALGEQWHEDEWEDQYEAFDAILTCLEARGESDSALRIHPNLLNKSVRYVKRELERIRWISARHPDLVVIYPQEPVNSYRLVEGAKRVVVSMSTIGLEASAAGKPVWATSANSYDLIADIRRVLRPGDLTMETLEIWNVSDLGARRYLAEQLLEGVPYAVFLKKFKFPTWQTLPFRNLLFRLSFSLLRAVRKRVVLRLTGNFSLQRRKP